MNAEKTNIGVFAECPGIGSSTTTHALVWLLNKAGFPFIFGSSSLRNLATELGVPNSGEKFAEFLKGPYISNDHLDRLWDANFTEQVRAENQKGRFLVFESKVAPVLNIQKREHLHTYYLRNKEYLTSQRVLEMYVQLPNIAELNNIFVVCLSGSIDGTIQRMKNAGRFEEANLLPSRVRYDSLRYVETYGFNPYDINLIRGAGVADVIIPTLKETIYSSVKKILGIFLGERLSSPKVEKALRELEELCKIGDPVKVKNALEESNRKNGLIFTPVVSRVIDEMRRLGYEYKP